MSKNILRWITLVREPIWGIHSLSLIISWSDIKTCKGISIQPLSVVDISLYSFLCWIVSEHNDIDPKKGIAIPVCNNADDDR